MKFLAILCLLFSTTVFSQDARHILKFSPLALIDDGSFPTIQFGDEFKLSKRISWFNEVGVRYRKSYLEQSDTNLVNPAGFKIKTEFRYYRSKDGGKDGPGMIGKYFALNAYYIQDNHNTEIGYYYQHDSSNVVIDDFGVRKRSVGINLLMGAQRTFGKRFLLDMYVGVGARMRFVRTTNKEYRPKDDLLISSIDLTIQHIRNDNDALGGNTPRPILTMGVRLCYALF